MSEMIIFLMVSLNGGQGDLLTMVPTDSYWQQQKIAATSDHMLPFIKQKAVADISDLAKKLGSPQQQEREDAQKKIVEMGPGVVPQLQALTKSTDAEVAMRAQAMIKNLSSSEGAIQRLMAIRTLGELKSKEALDDLAKFKDSKEPFVALYAQTAIDRINGKEPAHARIDPKLMQQDLYLLPANCGLVAQATIGIGQFETPAKALEAIQMPEGVNKEETVTHVTAEIMKLGDTIGNFRLDGVTVGVADNVGDENGFVVLIARGQYDRQHVRQAVLDLRTRMEAHSSEGVTASEKEILEAKNVDGIELLTMGNVVLILPSDDRVVFMVGPTQDKLPIKEMAAAVKAGKGKLADNADMAKLIKSIDTTQGIWAAAKITDAYKKADLLAPFTTMTLVADSKDNCLKATLVAQGDDAEKAKAAKEQVEALLKTARAEMAQAPAFIDTKPIVDAIDSVKIEFDAKGAKTTATGEIKGLSIMRLFLPMIMQSSMRMN